MLVLWDRGLHSYAQVRATRDRGAHVLGRIGAGVTLAPEEELSDGSFLTTLYPSDRARRIGADGLQVRVIEYTIDDPARPRPDERWEIETVLDEVKVHQIDRRPAPHLRSRHPREVVQEIYGLALAHRAIHCLMTEAAARAHIDPSLTPSASDRPAKLNGIGAEDPAYILSVALRRTRTDTTRASRPCLRQSTATGEPCTAVTSASQRDAEIVAMDVSPRPHASV